MKKRNGFVSNSSSASFIIELNCSKETAMSHFRSICNDNYEKEKLKKEIQKDYEYFQKIENSQYLIHKKEDIIKELEDELESIDKNFIELLLKKNDMHIDEVNGNAVVKKWTVMFNDYNDMGSILTNWLFTLKVDGFDFNITVEEDY